MTNKPYHIPIHFDEDGRPWKEYDDAEVNSIPVTIHGFSENGMFYKHNNEVQFRWSPTQLFKRPTPKVYDADGVQIKVGDTVYRTDPPLERAVVFNIRNYAEGQPVVVCESEDGHVTADYSASLLTHKRPAFDADGVRIRKGDTVWVKDAGFNAWTVTRVTDGYISVRDADDTETEVFVSGSLTHREPDSLEKLREDMSDYLDACNEEWHELREYTDRLTTLIERDA